MKEVTITSDGALYEELSKPFENADAANAALKAFVSEMREVRKKHKMKDVLMVCAVSLTYADGQVGEAQVSTMHGDHLKEEALAAFAYGKAAESRKQLINKLLSGKNPD
jgi:hypothetical protein